MARTSEKEREGVERDLVMARYCKKKSMRDRVIVRGSEGDRTRA